MIKLEVSGKVLSEINYALEKYLEQIMIDPKDSPISEILPMLKDAAGTGKGKLYLKTEQNCHTCKHCFLTYSEEPCNTCLEEADKGVNNSKWVLHE